MMKVFCIVYQELKKNNVFSSEQTSKVKSFWPETPRRKRDKKIPSKIDGDTNQKGKPSTLITIFDAVFSQDHMGNQLI